MDRLLDDAKRLVLAWPGRTVPLLSPMAFWWDSDSLWFSTPKDSAKATAFKADPTVAAYVPPLQDGEAGLVARGRARVFGLNDPVGLGIHGAMLATAQAALMAKNAASMMGYVVDAPRIPQRFAPANRVLVRVTVDDTHHVIPPDVGPGIAPALPAQVPPEIRRRLSGQRRVVLATRAGDGFGLLPAVWGAGFGLTLPDDAGLPGPLEDTIGTLVLDNDPGFRPSEVAGMSLTGGFEERPGGLALAPTKVRWWDGFRLESAAISAKPTDTIVIPD